jgi:hypothetical protein
MTIRELKTCTLRILSPIDHGVGRFAGMDTVENGSRRSVAIIKINDPLYFGVYTASAN